MLKQFISQRNHLKDANESYRVELSKLWERGIKDGTTIDTFKAMIKRNENRIDYLNDRIFKNTN